MSPLRVRISLPIEISRREFDAKLYLAVLLADSGHKAYIGKGVYVGHDIIDPDILLSKYSYADMKNKNKIGAKLFLLDAEQGTFMSIPNEIKPRIPTKYKDAIDHYLAWNSRCGEIAEKRLENTKVTVIGNPRFDLLQQPLKKYYKEEGAELLDQFGKFILINTSSPLVNRLGTNSPPKNTRKINEERYKKRKKRYESFIKAIDEISDKINCQIIIRPHPMENEQTYMSRYKNKTNVGIIKQGSVNKWISASQLVVHNSSTTGVEAALMNKKVYSYIPDPQTNPYKSLTPNQVSIMINSVSDLVQNIKEDLRREKTTYQLDQIQKNRIREHVDNIDYLSARKIVGLIESTQIGNVQETSYTPGLKEFGKRHLMQTSGAKTFHLIRNMLKGDWRAENQYEPFKPTDEVRDQAYRFSSILDISGIKVDRINNLENTFRVYKK